MSAVMLTGPTVTQNSPVLILPTHERWPGWVGLGGLVEYKDGIPAYGHPSEY